MSFLKTLGNNIRHDIWGNFLMCKQLGSVEGYSFLARKSVALASAIVRNKTVKVNDRLFFDTWN